MLYFPWRALYDSAAIQLIPASCRWSGIWHACMCNDSAEAAYGIAEFLSLREFLCSVWSDRRRSLLYALLRRDVDMACGAPARAFISGSFLSLCQNVKAGFRGYRYGPNSLQVGGPFSAFCGDHALSFHQ